MGAFSKQEGERGRGGDTTGFYSQWDAPHNQPNRPFFLVLSLSHYSSTTSQLQSHHLLPPVIPPAPAGNGIGHLDFPDRGLTFLWAPIALATRNPWDSGMNPATMPHYPTLPVGVYYLPKKKKALGWGRRSSFFLLLLLSQWFYHRARPECHTQHRPQKCLSQAQGCVCRWKTFLHVVPPGRGWMGRGKRPGPSRGRTQSRAVTP